MNILKYLKRLFKKQEDETKEFKEYNALNLNILCRPNIPIQYLENCRDNLYILDTLSEYLKQYYMLIYIQDNDTDIYKELTFYLDKFTHYQSIYKISIMEMVDFINRYFMIDGVSSMVFALDQYHRLTDIMDYTNDFKVLNMLTEDLAPINCLDTKIVTDDIALHNIPDINKIYYDYKSYSGKDEINLPEYLFSVQARHENLNKEEFDKIKDVLDTYTVDNENEETLNLQYAISYETITDPNRKLLYRFNYLSDIDNINYLSKLKDESTKNSIFANLQVLDDEVDEIVEESELQDKER